MICVGCGRYTMRAEKCVSCKRKEYSKIPEVREKKRTYQKKALSNTRSERKSKRITNKV